MMARWMLCPFTEDKYMTTGAGLDVFNPDYSTKPAQKFAKVRRTARRWQYCSACTRVRSITVLHTHNSCSQDTHNSCSRRVFDCDRVMPIARHTART